MRGTHARWAVGASVLALAVSACGSSTNSTDDAGDAAADFTNTQGRVVKYNVQPDEPLTTPGSTGEAGIEVLNTLFTGLVNYNPDTSVPENAQAESITPSADSTKYSVVLKPGWKFHNGEAVTAKSYVDAWNYTASGKNAQANSSFFQPILGFADVTGEDSDGDGKLEVQPKSDTLKGLVVTGENSFDITLSSPQPTFVERLGVIAYSPLPQSFYADPKAFGRAPVGNGPFKFVKWEDNVEIAVTRNDDYQGPDKPTVKDISFQNFANDDAAYTALRQGTIDIMESLPLSSLPGEKYKTDLDQRYVEGKEAAIGTIVFPSYVTKYSNPDLRKAISLAIDRDTISRTIFGGARTPASGWVAQGVAGFEPGACGEFCTYDPAKAKDYLARAGAFQGPITITYNGGPGDNKTWVDAVCVSIKNALGVECNGIGTVDAPALGALIGGRKLTGPFRSTYGMDYPSIDNFLVSIYSKDGSANFSGYDNPAYDALLTKAAGEPREQALKTYQEAERLLAVDMPAIPTFYYGTRGGYSDRVSNVKITAFGDTDWASVRVK